jgi:hypothetical protein
VPFDTENVRVMLRSWYPVSKFEWEHGYHHPAMLDRTGPLFLKDGSRLQWGIRPGGLGWLKHPDGRTTYLARDRGNAPFPGALDK